MFTDNSLKNGFSFIFVKVDEGESVANEVKNIAEDKKIMFFAANEFGRNRNLNRLYKEMFLFFEHEYVGKTKVDIDKIFDYIKTKSVKESMVWAFDNVEEIFDEEDFPKVYELLNFLKSTKSTVIFASKNEVFTNKFENSKLIKLMTTSQKTQKANLKGFYGLEDVDISAEDKFKYYAIFGDKNEYRKKIDFSKGLKNNVVDSFFNTQGFFYSEPNRILKKELRETQVYNLILEAIAKGNTTLNEISEFVELPTSICNKYTTVLLSLGIITKVKPVFGQDTRKSRYKIKSNVMEFWYYFVPDNMSEIDFNNGEKVFEKNVETGIHQYLQIKFPELCTEYINKLKNEKKISFDIIETGPWWSKKEKIDIVAGNGIDVLCADCFWRNYEVGRADLLRLEKKAKEISAVNREYYLFSKEGFSEDLLDLATKRGDIKLFAFRDIVKDNQALKVEKPRRIGFFFRR